MAKGNNSKSANDSGLNFEVRLWAAAKQATPAPHWEESRTPAALREALLPKLLSVELRVADVEEVVHNPERQTV